MGFTVLADNRVKLKENENKNKYQDLARESKKTVKRESNGITDCCWCPWCYIIAE